MDWEAGMGAASTAFAYISAIYIVFMTA